MKMTIDIEEVKQYITEQSAETKIYFGADSERVNVDGRWAVDYLMVIVIHIDGKHGAKVFGEIQRDHADYDKNLGRPRLRLMNEVYRITELYMKFADFLDERHVEIHLDLNPKLIHGSSCAVAEAIGYVKGVCGINPVVKPHSWAGSIVADRLKTM